MLVPLLWLALAAALLVEHRLIARAHPGYFRWGLVCYSTGLYPEDRTDADASLEEAERDRRAALVPVVRLLQSRGQVPSRSDPHSWWSVRPLDATSFALVPRVNPLLLRARITVDDGVALDGFVPYSVLSVAVALVLVPSWILAVGILAALAAGIAAFHFALDRLIYGTIEPMLRSGDEPGARS